MAEVKLAGGVLIDIATREDVERANDRLAQLLERPHARFFRAFGGRPPRAANAPFVVTLQPSRPPAGMLWLVQWAIFSGDDPTASAAIANARGALFVGNVPTDASLSGNAPVLGADAGALILSGVAIPTTNTIPDKSVVYTNEDLYAIIAGSAITAGANNYRVTVGILELPQTPEALMW